MRVEIRKSAAGTEYWDNVEKRTVLVPHGSKPDFEVTDNPTTMVDVSGGDKAKVNPEEEEAKKLREFAKENNIEIPFNVKKVETIRKYIDDALASVNNVEDKDKEE